MHRSDLFPRGEKAEPARARNEPKMCKQPDAWSETWHDVRDDLFSPRTATGGIAQLVERQLCKLDVRGSSPRASTSFGKETQSRACSSVGQSTRLISAGSQVQVLSGPPAKSIIEGKRKLTSAWQRKRLLRSNRFPTKWVVEQQLQNTR